MKYLILFFLTILGYGALSQTKSLKEKCCKPAKVFQKAGPRKLFCDLATGDFKSAKKVYITGAKAYQDNFLLMHYMMLAILQKDTGNVDAMKNMARAASERMGKIEKGIYIKELSGLERRVLLEKLDCLKSAWENVQAYIGYSPTNPFKLPPKLPPRGVQVKPLDAEKPNILDIQRSRNLDSRIISIKKIFYDIGETNFDQSEQKLIEQSIRYYMYCGTCVITVIGYADGIGSTKKSNEVSETRVQNIRTFLVENGVVAADILSFYNGEAAAKQRGKNGKSDPNMRRVEIEVSKK